MICPGQERKTAQQHRVAGQPTAFQARFLHHRRRALLRQLCSLITLSITATNTTATNTDSNFRPNSTSNKSASLHHIHRVVICVVIAAMIVGCRRDTNSTVPDFWYSETIGNVNALTFVHGTSSIVTGDSTGRILYWSIDNQGKGRLRCDDTGFQDAYGVRSVAAAPSGREVVAGDDGGRVWIVSLLDRGRHRIIAEHFGPVWAVAYSDDGTRIISAGAGVILTDATSGSRLASFTKDGLIFNAVAFVNGSDVVWVAASDEYLECLSAKDLTPISHAPLNVRSARAIAYSAALKAVVVSSNSPAGRGANGVAVRVDEAAQVTTLPIPWQCVGIVAADRDLVACAMADGTATVIDARRGEAIWNRHGDFSEIMSVAISADQRSRVAIGDTHRVRVFEINH